MGDFDLDTLTAEVYSVWLLQTMTAMPDGPEFKRLMDAFEKLHNDLDHLETCYQLPPYETD